MPTEDVTFPTGVEAAGTVEYNGVTFSGPAYRSEVNGDPVYDDAGRTVKYLKWTLDYTGYVAVDDAGSPTDTNATLESLRQSLTKPGGILKYETKGFGGFTINDGDVQDVKWGPKPELFFFQPMGDQNAALVRWRVTAHIPECDDAKYRFALLSANWSVGWDIDREGYTRITVNGSIEIPLTHQNGKVLRKGVLDHADNYRELITAQAPLGFRPDGQRFSMSEDRTRLEFDMAWQQIPVPLVNGSVRADVRHRIRSVSIGGRARVQVVNRIQWQNTLSGTINVSPTEPRSRAWDVFRQILASRVFQVERFRRLPAIPFPVIAEPLLGVAPGTIRQPGSVNMFLTDASWEEDVFGRSSTFSVSYLLHGVHIREVLLATGLWQPIQNTSFASWRRSIENSAGNVRGAAGMTFNPQSDAIIDLCLPTAEKGAVDLKQRPPNKVPPGVGDGNQLFAGPPPKNPIENPNALASGNEQAPFFLFPEATWLTYNASLELIENDHIVRHKPLAGEVQVRQPEIDAVDNLKQGFDKKPKKQIPVTTTTTVDDKFQRVGSPSFAVRFFGNAMRAGYRIPDPQLARFAGNEVLQVQKMRRESVGDWLGGVPVNVLVWDILYYPTKTPRYIPALANPATGMSGQP